MTVVRCLCFLLLFNSPTFSQSISEEAVQELDTFLESSVDAGKVPGLVALVTTADSVIYHRAVGMQHVAEGRAMRLDSLFRIASMTKPVTSVAVMQLVEMDHVSLDDPIARYLPEYASLKKLADVGTQPVDSDVTIRQLLNHTSGFGYLFSHRRLSDINRSTGENYEQLPLVHEPGAQWTYGCGTRILGYLLEHVTEKKLDAYFDEHLFHPLGMEDTGFKVAQPDLQRLVTVHRRRQNQLNEEAIAANEDGEIVGDYGLRSTARDYSRFLQMLLAGGEVNGHRILSEDSIQQMTSNQIGELTVQKQAAPRRNISLEFPIGAGRDKFGLGFQLSVANEQYQRSPGSGSWAGIYNTHFWFDPHRQVAVVLMMQLLPFYDTRCIELLQGFEQRLYHGLR